MSKPTPETDSMELWPKEISEKIQVVRSDFARRLERERDAARALLPEVERLVSKLLEGSHWLSHKDFDDFAALLAALKEKP